MRRRHLLLPLALGAACASPAAAGAATICVHTATACAAPAVSYDDLGGGLAYAAANPGPDEILLGPSPEGGDIGPFQYAGDPLEIRGAGADTSELTSGGDTLRLSGAVTVSGVTVTTTGPAADALRVQAGSVTVRDGVLEAPTGGEAARASGNLTLRDSSVDGPVLVDDGGTSEITGSTISGAVSAVGHDLTVRRSRVGGGWVSAGAELALENVLVTTAGPDAAGLRALANGTIRARYATVARAPGAGVGGTGIVAQFSGKVFLTDSIVEGHATSLARLADGQAPRIEVDHSSYDPARVVETASAGEIVAGPGNLAAPAAFAAPAAGDFRLLAGAPQVDAAAVPAGTLLDLPGTPRALDGDGDGVARPDMGAFEGAVAVPAPPGDQEGPVTPPGGDDGPGPAADTAAPALSRLRIRLSGRRPRLTLVPSEAAALFVRIERARPGRRAGRRCARRGSGAPCTRWVPVRRVTPPAGTARTVALGRRLPAGRYRAIVRATDAAGNRSAPATVRFRVR